MINGTAKLTVNARTVQLALQAYFNARVNELGQMEVIGFTASKGPDGYTSLYEIDIKAAPLPPLTQMIADKAL